MAIEDNTLYGLLGSQVKDLATRVKDNQTIFYMNASESGATRHLYKKPDMTDAATSQEVFNANDKGQVILRISTSATPEMYSDAYLQNAYKATGDYQLLFLDEKSYRSFDTTSLSDSTFAYSTRILQDKLTAGTNISISGNTISATDTTYSDFVGTDGTAVGTAGLVPAPATADAGKVLSANGSWTTPGTGVKTLTTADYNYPTTGTKTDIAPWLLDDGYYLVENNVNVRPDVNNSYAVGTRFIIKAGASVLMQNDFYSIFGFYSSYGSLSGKSVSNTYGAQVLTNDNVVDNLTSTSTVAPLSAKQGKALNDKIEGRLKTNAGAPTTSTVGTVGQLLEDTTNGKLYICTDATNPYVWEEIGGWPTITMTTTDPGEGSPLAANTFVAVYSAS